jgi:cytochrome c biogenesis protein CcdA/thiol-disulfide isomerase/thioredoxin
VGVAKGRLRPLGTILGLICSFSFFTLALSTIVHKIGISPIILRYIAIGLIAFFGLVMLFPRLSNWFASITSPIAALGQKLQDSKPRTGFGGGFVFGIALGLLWTPCAGPILGAITTLVATGGINLTAVLMTLAYGMGAGSLMLLYAYGSAKLINSSKFLSRYTERIRQFFGVLMLMFAAILLLNWDMIINQKISNLFPEILSEKNLKIEKHLQSVTGKSQLSENTPAPELTGISGWINSPPLTIKELRGKVVLVDFWTYSCINCIRTIPHLNQLYDDYKEHGLVIIGVHTPEFEFEKNYDNVKNACIEFKIKYPVALDNDYATWQAYHNSFWPAHYLIDQNGIIRMSHFGEGDYAGTENAVRELLGMAPLEIKDQKESSSPLSNETYLGFSRAHSYSINISADKAIDYQYDAPLKNDQVGLRGPWIVRDDHIEARGNDSYLDMNFLAAHVYLVLGGESPDPIEVTLDGKPYGKFNMSGDKKYNIVDNSYGRHRLSIKFPKGIEAYAFTFGD